MRKSNTGKGSQKTRSETGVKKAIEQLEKKISALDAQNFLLKNLIDKLPGDIYWKDNNGVWTGMNKRCAQSLHRMGFIQHNNKSEVIGKTDYQLFNKNTADGYRKNDLEVMEKKTELTREEHTQLLSGEKLVLLSIKSPILDKKGSIVGVVGNTIDITHLKHIESELKIAKEAAEAANHAKTEFIANMSHDIRTPLTGITGLSKMIEKNATDPSQKNYAHLLTESGDELLKLLNGILELMSADNINENDMHEEPFDLRRMMVEIEHLERPTTIDKGIDFLATFDERIPPCFIGDRTKIHRILLNLLGNAIKFTAKGNVEVNMSLLHDEDTHAWVQFRVSDTGIGISPEMQDKVFDRFFRVSPSYKGIYTGHGVGLHIAQSYAHLLGSEIKLTSEPGVGTTFYFDLSLKIGDAAQLQPSISPSIIDETINNCTVLPQIFSEPLLINTTTLPQDAPRLLLIEDNAIAL